MRRAVLVFVASMLVMLVAATAAVAQEGAGESQYSEDDPCAPAGPVPELPDTGGPSLLLAGLALASLGGLVLCLRRSLRAKSADPACFPPHVGGGNPRWLAFVFAACLILSLALSAPAVAQDLPGSEGASGNGVTGSEGAADAEVPGSEGASGTNVSGSEGASVDVSGSEGADASAPGSEGASGDCVTGSAGSDASVAGSEGAEADAAGSSGADANAPGSEGASGADVPGSEGAEADAPGSAGAEGADVPGSEGAEADAPGSEGASGTDVPGSEGSDANVPGSEGSDAENVIHSLAVLVGGMIKRFAQCCFVCEVLHDDDIFSRDVVHAAAADDGAGRSEIREGEKGQGLHGDWMLEYSSTASGLRVRSNSECCSKS